MRIAALVLVAALLPATLAHAQGRSARKVNPVVPGNNAFAFDLYRELTQGEGNVFFSPYSISTAVALAMLGAGGETALEIRRAMRYPEHDTDLHGGMAHLIRTLDTQAGRDSLELRTANALWADDSLAVTRRYQTHLQRFYKVGIERTSFATAPDAARVRINDWVAEATADKIRDLMPSGSITPETQLVLANAVYFRAAWAHAFPKNDTKTAAFTRTDGGRVDVPMMNARRSFPYAETDVYQAVELPYKGDHLAMLVVLPKTDHTLADVEGGLTGDAIDSLVAGLDARAYDVDTFLPRFRVTYSRTLNHALVNLGMAGAFQDDANFRGISEETDLKISQVVHKAYVDVTEEGTEAAAATGITMIPTSASRPKTPITFRADHPFVFLIRDRETGAILFVGRVVDPTE